jgi:hypothetical protein
VRKRGWQKLIQLQAKNSSRFRSPHFDFSSLNNNP